MSYDKEQDALKAYEEFRLQWLIDHGFTLADLIKELDVLQQEMPSLTVSALFEDWEYGYGFDSEIWPCFEEWLEYEGKQYKE